MPIAAADVEEHRELAEHGREALLLSPGDVKAWSAAFEQLLARPELAERLGCAARERAVEDFSIGQMADRHLRLFEDLVARRKAVKPGLFAG